MRILILSLTSAKKLMATGAGVASAGAFMADNGMAVVGGILIALLAFIQYCTIETCNTPTQERREKLDIISEAVQRAIFGALLAPLGFHFGILLSEVLLGSFGTIEASTMAGIQGPMAWVTAGIFGYYSDKIFKLFGKKVVDRIEHDTQ